MYNRALSCAGCVTLRLGVDLLRLERVRVRVRMSVWLEESITSQTSILLAFENFHKYQALALWVYSGMPLERYRIRHLAVGVDRSAPELVGLLPVAAAYKQGRWPRDDCHHDHPTSGSSVHCGGRIRWGHGGVNSRDKAKCRTDYLQMTRVLIRPELNADWKEAHGRLMIISLVVVNAVGKRFDGATAAVEVK